MNNFNIYQDPESQNMSDHEFLIHKQALTTRC